MKIKPRGKIYSINEGYAKYWYDPVIDYVESKKNPKVRNLHLCCAIFWYEPFGNMENVSNFRQDGNYFVEWKSIWCSLYWFYGG